MNRRAFIAAAAALTIPFDVRAEPRFLSQADLYSEVQGEVKRRLGMDMPEFLTAYRHETLPVSLASAELRVAMGTADLGAEPWASAGTPCEGIPPFIRQGDPIAALFQEDLHRWAMTNRVPHARVFVHPMLANLVPPQGMTNEFSTSYRVSVQPMMPAPWAIVADCG